MINRRRLIPRFGKGASGACCLAVCLLLLVGAVAALAQAHPPQAQASAQAAAQHGAAAHDKAEAAAGEIAGQPSTTEVEEDEQAQFKHSKAVVWLSHLLGLNSVVGYWLFACINFAIIAGFLYWASRLNVAKFLRNRTANIQKGIEEARRASAEANARLAEVQARLAKIDQEVAQIRDSADADFQAEEQRIRQAADEDAKRVVEEAKSEIEAIAKSARRELKSYAAELSVELARKNIKIDSQTDAALLRSFARELGKDGK